MQIGVQKQEILLTAHILSCILFFMSLVVFFFSPDKAVSSGFLPVLTMQSLLYEKVLTRQNRGRDCGVQFCSASRSLHPTAVMSAAPFPLPSSDSRKVTSQLGARSLTVWCMILEKLQKGTRAVGEGGSRSTRRA